MAGFDNAQKYLRYFPVRKATKTEAVDAAPPFDKYYGLVKSRTVQLIYNTITLPAHTVDVTGHTTWQRILFQYNMTLPGNFCLLMDGLPQNVVPPEADHSFPIYNGIITVKFILGGVVYRYWIYGDLSDGPPNYPMLAIPKYTSQVIPPNCVFEFMMLYYDITLAGIPYPLNFKASILETPSSPDDTGQVFTGTPIDLAQLGYNLPMTLPQQQPNTVWLSN